MVDRGRLRMSAGEIRTIRDGIIDVDVTHHDGISDIVTGNCYAGSCGWIPPPIFRHYWNRLEQSAHRREGHELCMEFHPIDGRVALRGDRDDEGRDLQLFPTQGPDHFSDPGDLRRTLLNATIKRSEACVQGCSSSGRPLDSWHPEFAGLFHERPVFGYVSAPLRRFVPRGSFHWRVPRRMPEPSV